MDGLFNVELYRRIIMKVSQLAEVLDSKIFVCVCEPDGSFSCGSKEQMCAKFGNRSINIVSISGVSDAKRKILEVYLL